MNVGNDMSRAGTLRYRTFLDELRVALLNRQAETITPLLDGRAGSRCFDLVPEASVRRLGAFFTPSKVALRIVSQLLVRKWADAVVFDPACGAGDLLLPIARKLPVRPTASETMRLWNGHILGCDLSAEFIQAARLRLTLLAVKRGAVLDGDPDALADLLSNLSIANGLTITEKYANSTHIVMNPPFGRVQSGAGLSWREGTVTAAALFVERAARLCAPGTQIVALLPEVLRTGSSYEGWRSHVGKFVALDRPASLGRFSAQADVDVFIQRLTRRRAETTPNRRRRQDRDKAVGSHFVVNVGAVVPHRHRRSGPSVAFLHAGNAAAWSEIRRINETRKFRGKLFMPPFVAIRRTSRPGDPYRATATLILGKRKVAVENHLIVAVPKRGAVPICRALVRFLHSAKTSAALDRAIRCRHLTTASVSSLPWP